MANPSLNEQLAVLTALQKAVKERLTEVRAAADGRMLEAYREEGVTRKALLLGGTKVGDYIVLFSGEDWEIVDPDAFIEFALSYGLATVERQIRPECMARAVSIIADEAPELLCEVTRLDADWRRYIKPSAGHATFLDSGEPVPGLEPVRQEVKGTQVRGCKPDEVLPALRSLGGIDRLLLGDSDR